MYIPTDIIELVLSFVHPKKIDERWGKIHKFIKKVHVHSSIPDDDEKLNSEVWYMEVPFYEPLIFGKKSRGRIIDIDNIENILLQKITNHNEELRLENLRIREEINQLRAMYDNYMAQFNRDINDPREW